MQSATLTVRLEVQEEQDKEEKTERDRCAKFGPEVSGARGDAKFCVRRQPDFSQ